MNILSVLPVGSVATKSHRKHQADCTMAFMPAVGLFVIPMLQVMFLLILLFCVFRIQKPGHKERQGRRIISLWLYFSFYLWLSYLAVCEPILSTVYTRYVAPCMLAICFVIVLLESGFSHELEYLKNFSHDGTAWECIQNLHLIPPKIYMTVECYHYEYQNDNTVRRIEIFKDQEELLFGSWIDVSETEPRAERNAKAAVVQVKINPAILFGDQETFEQYKRLATAMIDRNLHRDEYIDFSLRIEIPDMKKRFLSSVDLRVKPFWMRPLFFWIATLLWMTWPYRWLFRAKTGKIHYTLKKKIYKSATPVTTEIADPAIADLVVVNTSAPYVLVPYPPLDTALAATLSHLSSPSWMQHTAERSCRTVELAIGDVPVPRTLYGPSLAALNVPGPASCLPHQAEPQLEFPPPSPVLSINPPPYRPSLSTLNVAGPASCLPHQAEPQSEFPPPPSYEEAVGCRPIVPS